MRLADTSAFFVCAHFKFRRRVFISTNQSFMFPPAHEFTEYRQMTVVDPSHKRSLNPKPYTLNHKPDTLNPKPYTRNPKP